MLEEDFVWHCWVILQGMRASKVSCFAMAKGGPEKEPAPLSWRFCPLLCWLKALPRPLLLPEGECFGMLHVNYIVMIHGMVHGMVQNIHQVVRILHIVFYHDELTEGPPPPFPPWGWISLHLWQVIFSTSRHVPILMPSLTTTSISMRAFCFCFCVSIWETSCVWCSRENETVSNYVL